MTPESVLDIGKSAIQIIFLVAGPMLGLSMVVGLMVSIFQAVTSINEATLTFVPKVATVFTVLLVTFPWIIQIILGFMTSIFTGIPDLVR